MNAEIRTYNFNDLSVRILTDEHGDPWFVLKDCMNILGLGNPTETVKMFDDDKFSITEVIDSIGRRQQAYIISEPGLYRLTMRSRKPEAKEFQRWVTREVLPSIRKHGACMTPQPLDRTPANHETTTQSFTFNGNQVRTILNKDGNTLFCAKDVATILGYTNPNKAIRDHTRGERIVHPLKTSSGMQEIQFITEGDLYRLIVSSKLPSAERFERWIYDEVIPSIRKTGGYIPAAEADSDEDILAKAVLIAQKTIERKNQQLKAKDAQIKALEPKAKALDAFTNVRDRLLVRDAAKILSNTGTPISEKQLREWMKNHGWIYKADCSWHATAKHCTAGHLVMIPSQDHVTKADGTKFAYPPTVRITRKGLVLLHKRLGETLLTRALETAND